MARSVATQRFVVTPVEPFALSRHELAAAALTKDSDDICRIGVLFAAPNELAARACERG